MVVGTGGDLKTIPHAFITDLSFSNGQKRSLGRVLPIGLGTGALGGGLVGAMTYTVMYGRGVIFLRYIPQSPGYAFVQGALVEGVLGFVTGGIVGFFIKRDRWQRLPVQVSANQFLPVDGSENIVYPSLSIKRHLKR